jgi:iron(III) transport system permease protein
MADSVNPVVAPIERSSASPGRALWPVQASGSHILLNVVAGAIAALMLLPLIYLVWRALGVGDALPMLFRPSTAIILWNSVLLAFLVTFFSLLLSLPLAWLTVRTDLPGRRIWSVLVTLPLVFPSYVGGYTLVAMLGPRGIIQGWLEPLGIERLPSIYGLFGATYALTLFTYPYLLLSIRAGLRNLDPALEEAARGLGYGPWQTFRKITLPALRPAIGAGVLLVALYVLSDFGAVSILRYNSFTRAIYLQYLSSFDRSYAALLALVLVALTLLLLFAVQRLQGRRNKRHYRTGVGTARAVQRVALGPWRWPALLLCATSVAAGLVIPLAVVSYWLIRGLQAGESLLPAATATWNSIQASGLAALAAIILALPVAYLVVRFPSRYSTIINQSIYLGYGLPGIVIALSLVFFGANYVPWLYQTLLMLIFAYTVRFLPQATGNVRTSLLQISPRLEEASRSLGVGRRETLRRITLPLLQPGIWAGAALVFLSTMKELPATLLLGPTGFTTLATQIWSATAEAFFARAAAPSLILLAVSALSIAIILSQEERGAS